MFPPWFINCYGQQLITYNVVLTLSLTPTCYLQLGLGLLALFSRRLRQRRRIYASMLSICLSVCLSIAKMRTKTRFSQKLSSLKQWSLLTTNRKSYMSCSQNPFLNPKIQDGRHLPSWKSLNRHIPTKIKVIPSLAVIFQSCIFSAAQIFMNFFM